MSGAWSNDQLNSLFIYDTSGNLILRIDQNGMFYEAPQRLFVLGATGFSIKPLPIDGSEAKLTTDSALGGVLFLKPIDSSVAGVSLGPSFLAAGRDDAATSSRPFLEIFSPAANGLGQSYIILHGQDSGSATDDSYMEVIGTLAYRHLYDQRTADAAGITTTTLVAVNTVTLPVAGTYSFDGLWGLTSTVAAGRPAFALGGTATASAWRWQSSCTHYNTAVGSQAFNASGTTFPASTSGTNLVNSDWTTTAGHSSAHIKGTVTVSAPGTLSFQYATNGAGNTITVKAGSMVTVELIDNF